MGAWQEEKEGGGELVTARKVVVRANPTQPRWCWVVLGDGDGGGGSGGWWVVLGDGDDGGGSGGWWVV
ncbi:hypothetical protein QYF36_004122 [Acer negundo]|nr:hypothetical protein QYF36_004122 [Acer negundo]